VFSRCDAGILSWKRKNLMTLPTLQNIIIDIFKGALDKYLKVLANRICTNLLLSAVTVVKRCSARDLVRITLGVSWLK
jgi:hypothetical protein